LDLTDGPTVPRIAPWIARLKKLRLILVRAIPFTAGVITVVVGLYLYNALVPSPRPLNIQDVNEAVENAMASATPPPAYSERVYQAILPSLVLIQTKIETQDGEDDHGLGSGVIIDDAGDILTCLHVVANATEVLVTFADGSQATAQVAITQPENDIDVLHPDRLPALVVPAVIGNPNAMQVGDEAYVVGSPFGLYNSMSAGIISGFGRSFQPENSDVSLKNLIQFDAAVNPGNSGGPLLNRNGEVIGIVEGILNPSGQDFFIGIGFAVPINIAGGAVGSPLD